MSDKPKIKIELTPEQQKLVEQLTGKQVPAVKLSVELLEERLTPGLDFN